MGEFFVRPSARAKNLSVHVHPGGVVEIVAPLRSRPAEVRLFVDESRAWIERARHRLAREPAIDRRLPDSVELPAIEREVRVTYGADTGRRKFIDDGGAVLRLSSRRAHTRVSRDLLRRWLARTGRQVLVPWLRGLSREAGIDYAKTQVRGQKTRWGSCSSSGVISINYCLLFLEPELVRYLFLHELCHRRHFNHSRAYWKLLGRFEPDYRSLDKRLGAAWRSVPGWVLGQ